MKKLIFMFDYGSRIGKKLSDDNLNAFSAQAAFFLLTSLFPFIMLLLSLLQFFPFDMEDLIDAATTVLPSTINNFIVPVITEIYQKGTPTLISVTAITALWS
ncbi:MAG: YhjD/YihY/BrkB family envelope integrity protein, partial [Clostridia bacterium]